MWIWYEISEDFEKIFNVQNWKIKKQIKYDKLENVEKRFNVLDWRMFKKQIRIFFILEILDFLKIEKFKNF